MWLYVFVCVYYSLCLQIGADPASWVLYDSQTKIIPLTPFLILKPHNFPYNVMISGLNTHFHRRTCYVPRPRCSVLCPQVYRELIDVKGQPSHRGTILALKLKASRTDRGPSLHDGFQIAHYAGVDEKQTRNTWHNMGMLIWPSVIWYACRCYRFWWIFSQLCRRALNKKWQIPPNSGWRFNAEIRVVCQPASPRSVTQRWRGMVPGAVSYTTKGWIDKNNDSSLALP